MKHEIVCIECGQIREVKPQDIHQVVRCVECQRRYRKYRREKLREEKERIEIEILRLK